MNDVNYKINMTAKNLIDHEDIYDEGEVKDSDLPVVCDENRHHGKIEGSTLCLQCWRMKERVSLCPFSIYKKHTEIYSIDCSS